MKPERIEHIYNELGTLVISLEADPTTRGPAYLQDLISKTRGYLNQTSLYLHEVHREHHGLECELAALEAAYELSSDELLANDRRVTTLPNIDDRRAMINLLLRDERTKILDLKRALRELGLVEKAVKHRHKELDNTMSGIRLQKSLLESELRTGAYYGDESSTSRRKVGPSIDTTFDDAEILKLLGEEGQPTPLSPVDESIDMGEGAPSIVVEDHQKPKSVEPTEEEFASFLGEDDFSDILDQV